MEISFLNPETVIEVWDIRPGDKIADFGCGAGFFAIALGKRVGAQGKIYAIDVRAEALNAMRTRTKLFGIDVIEPIRADLERPKSTGIKDESIDKVLITNVLFQLENKRSMFTEASRILKPKGSLLVIEWKDDENIPTPMLPQRIPRKDLEALAEQEHFVRYKDFYAGSHHYGILFTKKV